MWWFVEERNTFGGWSPVIYKGDKPDPSRPERNKVWRNDPRPVPELLYNLGLKRIASCMSPDGEFFGVDVAAVSDFLKEGVSDRFSKSLNGGRG